MLLQANTLRRVSYCLHLFNNHLRKMPDSPSNFLMRKFIVNGQFLQIFGRIARTSTEIDRLRKTSSSKKYVKKPVFYAVNTHQELKGNDIFVSFYSNLVRVFLHSTGTNTSTTWCYQYHASFLPF